MNGRRGVVLIIVIGLVSIIAALTLSFIASARQAAAQMERLHAATQARLMLVAAAQYVQETSRLGWDDAVNDTVTNEAFGWIDVRGGLYDPGRFDATYGGLAVADREEVQRHAKLGPRVRRDTRRYRSVTVAGVATWIDDQAGADGIWDAVHSPLPVETWRTDDEASSWPAAAADRPAWPAVGSVVRCDVHRQERPPWALDPQVTPNAIAQDELDPNFGLPLLTHPDPLPAFGEPTLDALVLRRPADAGAWSLGGDNGGGARLLAWRQGDPRPVPGSENQSWFRIYRDGPATFTITCGSGATRGYRNWGEVIDAGDEPLFQDRGLFELARSEEVRLWYRIEWSAAVGGLAPNYGAYIQGGQIDSDAWMEPPRRNNLVPSATAINQGGTLRYIQRLRTPPEDGRW